MTQVAGTVVEHRPLHAGVLLYVWVGALVLIPSTLQFAPLGAAGTPAQVLGVLAAVWWFAAQLDRTHATLTPAQPTRTAMSVFVLAMLCSYLAAVRRPIEGVELSGADRGLILVVSWWGLVLLTGDGLVSRRNLYGLLRFLVVCTAAAGVLGVVQFATHISFVDQISIPGLTSRTDLSGVQARNGFARAPGTSAHPIEYGVLLTMVLPLALHFAFHDVRRSRVVRWFPVLAIAAALPLTMSRSAFLGLAVVLAVLFPVWTARQRVWSLVVVAVGLCAVYVAVPGMLGTMLRLFTGITADNSALSRTDSYDLAVEFIEQRPVFGRGFSTFLPTYRIIDNQWLGLLIETGVVGALAFLVVVVTSLVQSGRLSRTLPDPYDRSGARALMAAVASAAVACATFDAFGFPQVAGVLFFAVGCIAALRRHARRDDGSPPTGAPPPVLAEVHRP